MRSRNKAGAILAATLATALSLGMASGAQGVPTSQHDQWPDQWKSGETSANKSDRIVTLITGDRVHVDAKGRVTSVVPGKGREGTAVSVKRLKGHSYVIPVDAARLISQGRLDRRLFDVTELLKSKYDDQHRDTTPLIVAYTAHKAQAKAALRSAGLTVKRDLPAVGGQALTARKSATSGVWDALTDGSGVSRGAAAGIATIWLDGVRRASLDKSVPQIGAPDAWAAGYTGKGVKVAVLDTGVDDTHPDLSDRVIAKKNFSDSKNDVDHFGHGTHVASIVAGSGKKSDGKYKGVAPDAKLLAGKVLNDEGFGDDSGIIAGAQWAVDKGAKVINLSLGGMDTPEVDPLEAAVNKLSTTKGVLFAIAAGNSGPEPESVGSPGSAAEALTVGAVDKSDKLAEFSSVGPTVDGSLKPDITAPGVDIVAAKAAKGVIGTPAAPGYVTLSGTSMATPHVAGAAALIASQHPDWNGQQIKRTLTASAKPGDGLSVFQQGTGRVNLTTAIKHTVLTDQTSLSFGTQQWPHDDDKPVTKKITYRNTGSADVTLDVAVQALGPDGKPAPEGLFKADVDKVTVPAGKTVGVNVTADTRVDAKDGVYSGVLVAKAEGQTVRTTLALVREVESYNLTLKLIDAKGKPAETFGSLVALGGQPVWKELSGKGTLKVRVPKGTYVVDAPVFTPRAGGDADIAIVTQPKLSLTKDTSLTVDARKAKPIKITPPDSAAKILGAYSDWNVRVNDDSYGSSWFLENFKGITTAHLGPKLPAKQFTGSVGGAWGKGSTRWNLVYQRHGSFFTGYTHKTTKDELAQVNVIAGSPAKNKKGTVGAMWSDGNGGIGIGAGTFPVPGAAKHYVNAPSGLAWAFNFSQVSTKGDYEVSQYGPFRLYQVGKVYHATFNQGVFGPSVGKASDGYGAYRIQDQLGVCIPLFTDGSGHFGDSTVSKAKVVITADGKTIVDEKGVPCGAVFGLPDAKTEYKVSTDVSRGSAVSAVSTRIV
ncbi:S8 family peptidase, partial [Wenjunlia tyrosinilytica]|uniref:S8 family peptidase n=1 Tax=Wenjunlia tyrosinilytica TaxID=1544741 RepID=UPI0016677D22